MEEGILYTIEVENDYEGGGVHSIFSTYEKAKEFFDKYSCRDFLVDEMTISTIKIDHPEYQGKTLDTKRKT